MSEIWLTGPVPGVDALLMPAAHALLQARDDVRRLLDGVSIDEIWVQHGESASMGFHALHIAGATDRLLTYARGEQLNSAQIRAMTLEKNAGGLDAGAIIARVDAVIDAALDQIRATDPAALTQPREVGRRRLPSNVIGLIFHAAEHATRHAGQIATLRKVGGAAGAHPPAAL